MTSRTTSALGILAAALLFLAMLAPLFGAHGSTAPERQCTNCFRWGPLVGRKVPPLRGEVTTQPPPRSIKLRRGVDAGQAAGVEGRAARLEE